MISGSVRAAALAAAPIRQEDYRKWLRFIAEHRLGINEIQPPPKFSYHEGKVTMDAAEFDETARLLLR